MRDTTETQFVIFCHILLQIVTRDVKELQQAEVIYIYIYIYIYIGLGNLNLDEPKVKFVRPFVDVIAHHQAIWYLKVTLT